jgi:hypothetical protein
MDWSFDPSRVPHYALQNAPVLHLHTAESFWPGNAILHVSQSSPETADGQPMDIADDAKGQCRTLSLPKVNNQGVFLSHKVLHELLHLFTLTEMYSMIQGTMRER